VIWSPSGRHSIFAVPKGEHDNSTFFTNIIGPDLQTVFVQERGRRRWNTGRCIWTTPWSTMRGVLEKYSRQLALPGCCILPITPK
jgi:hypothetical protein